MAQISIGQIGQPYYDKTNDRTKGFLLNIHKTVREVYNTLGQTLEKAKGTRLSIRIITQGLSEEELRSVFVFFCGSPLYLEAIIPLNSHDYSIAYYGWNDKSRNTENSLKKEEEILVKKVMERNGKRRPYDYNDFAPEVTECGKDWSHKDISQLVDLYQSTFSGYLVDFSEELVGDMLQSNLVSLVRHKGRIVSAAVAEKADIPINGNIYRLSEISEVATHPDYQRQGLSHLTFSRLVESLKADKTDVIFTEARAASYGMMAVAWDTGMSPAGRLEKHCVISSPFSEVSQDGEYGNLVVFA